MEPRRPHGAAWTRTEGATAAREVWLNAEAGLVAVTELILVPLAAYRLTVSLADGGRCSAAEALLALSDFHLLAAQEADFARRAATRIFICPIGA